MRYLLVGNYGVGNLGDEALKEYFLQAFPDVEWRILSARPKRSEYPRLPTGVRSLLCTQWWRTLRALSSADGLVFGGGTLLTDTESVFACVLWWWHAMAARIFGKPYLLAFQGIGPFHTRMGEWFARRIVRQSAFISVRDRSSFDRIQNWNMNREVVLTFDPVFSLFLEKKIHDSSKNVFVIIPRRNPTVFFYKNLQLLLSQHQFAEVHILSLQPEDKEEQKVCRTLRHMIPTDASIIPVHTIDTLLREISSASLVFSQRYHGALAALARGKPLRVCPQEGADKLSSLECLFDENPQGLLRFVQEGEIALRIALRGKAG